MRKGIMRGLRLVFLFLCLVQFGASAPNNSEDISQTSLAAKGAKTQKPLSAIATPQALGDQIVQFFGHKTGRELMLEKAGNLASAGASATQALAGKPTRKSANATPLKPGYVPPPPRASVSQIRQEIQKIFDLNKKIQNVQSGRSVQLQRVQEQARIHQKILDEMESMQNKQTEGTKPSAKSALLAQEKLRLIHEETQRNTQVIEDLGPVPAGSVSKETPQEAPKETAKVSPQAKIPAS